MPTRPRLFRRTTSETRPTPPRPPRNPLLAVLTGAVLLGGGALFAVGSGEQAPAARLVGGNRPVNATATDPVDPSAFNSPALRASPTNASELAVATRVDAPSSSCAFHASLDGGATWAQRPLPMPPDRAIPCFAPDVAFGADGVVHVAFTSFNPVEGSGMVPDAVWLVRSSDAGATFTSPAMVAGPKAFQLRLAADPVRPGRLLLTWLQAAGTASWGFSDDGRPIVASRSDDGGTTWTEPATVNPPSRRKVVAPSVAIRPDGTPVVAYVDVGDDRLDYYGGHEGRGGPPYAGTWSLLAATSPDGGTTWQESVVDARLVPSQRFLMFFPPAPALAVDPRSGDAYVGFHDGRLGDADVWVWASPGGGRQWREPSRVNDTPPGDKTMQYLPQLAVAPDGRLDVVYYDRRRDSEDQRNEVSLQSSFDHGRHFTSRVTASDHAFDPRFGLGSDRGMATLGDRLGLVATRGGALAAWADTRSGFVESDKQDVATAVVEIRPPRRRPLLRVAGAAAGLIGMALALFVWVGRRRRVRPVVPTEGGSAEAAEVTSGPGSDREHVAG